MPSKHPYPDEIVPASEVKPQGTWRTALVNLAIYALLTAFSFGFWYLLFVAVASDF